jgi:hypothetical protein
MNRPIIYLSVQFKPVCRPRCVFFKLLSNVHLFCEVQEGVVPMSCRPLGCIAQENYLFNLFSKQHWPLAVKLAHNAMESFQQKVPSISLGAFEDIFDWKEENTTRCMQSPFFLEEVVYVLCHKLKKTTTTKVTRFNTFVHRHARRMGEWRNFRRERDHFQEWPLILTSFDKGKEEPRHYMLPWQTHAGEYNSDFNHQHFWPPPTPPPHPPRDFAGLSLGNCPQNCKQDLPKKVGVAAHAVISKKIA